MLGDDCWEYSKRRMLSKALKNPKPPENPLTPAEEGFGQPGNISYSFAFTAKQPVPLRGSDQ